MLLQVFRVALSRKSLGNEACRTPQSDDNGHPCQPLRIGLTNEVFNSDDENNDTTRWLTFG